MKKDSERKPQGQTNVDFIVFLPKKPDNILLKLSSLEEAYVPFYSRRITVTIT
ncbi:hypothetical protein [Enterococcus viikkiensis]